ncbi:hypothetical protein HK405_013566, partial [Cladochytrium tenue]
MSPPQHLVVDASSPDVSPADAPDSRLTPNDSPPSSFSSSPTLASLVSSPPSPSASATHDSESSDPGDYDDDDSDGVMTPVPGGQSPADKASLRYHAVVGLFKFSLDIFYREVRSRGLYKVPRTGPVIFVIAPHASQFVDPFVVLKHAGRKVGFLTAKKSMDLFLWCDLKIWLELDPEKCTVRLNTRIPSLDWTAELKPRSVIKVRSFLLDVAEVISDTEVRLKSHMTEEVMAALSTRGPDGVPAGLPFKAIPHVDQSAMYAAVMERLNAGGCVGVFPEGGSHDRSDLLPLKPGVAVMALGAMAQHPGLDVRIVPCGLNYFHADKFRSRVVIEFGDPLTVSPHLVSAYAVGGPEKRVAIASLLDTIHQAIKTVVVRAPDYDSLMVIQAARRLYTPPDEKMSIERAQVVSRMFAEVFERFKTEPTVKDLIVRVKAYNKLLASYGIADHQVKDTTYGGFFAFQKLLLRLAQAVVMFTLSAPGAILHTPIVIICSYVGRVKARQALAGSSVKIKGRDVVATWKMLAAIFVAPLMYLFYSG